MARLYKESLKGSACLVEDNAALAAVPYPRTMRERLGLVRLLSLHLFGSVIAVNRSVMVYHGSNNAGGPWVLAQRCVRAWGWCGVRVASYPLVELGCFRPRGSREARVEPNRCVTHQRGLKGAQRDHTHTHTHSPPRDNSNHHLSEVSSLHSWLTQLPQRRRVWWDSIP